MPLTNYPGMEKIRKQLDLIEITRSIQHEYNAEGIGTIIADIDQYLSASLDKLKSLEPDVDLKKLEPDDLARIRLLRPEGPRTLFKSLPGNYRDKLEGAMQARIAGCLLGSIVEGWSVKRMEEWAVTIGDEFPPKNYWSAAKSPLDLRYMVSKQREYTRDGMAGIAADDDIIYIVTALMILEKYGFGFRSSDVGDFWDEYLPWIYTDMQYALDKYKKGNVSAEHAADDNPYGHLICPYIRIDGYAWALPGQPEKAAELAYHDSHMSHRRNGIYGGMMFAAAESAAFAVDDPVEAIKIGLSEIPKDCLLAGCVRDALAAGGIYSYREARAWVDGRFSGMHGAHTINNACLTVFGLRIGGTDITKVISETVAMGIDNDCNAATAGSIAGAIAGARNIPEKWTRNFQNRIHTYIKNNEYVFLDNLLSRYENIARSGFDI